MLSAMEEPTPELDSRTSEQRVRDAWTAAKRSYEPEQSRKTQDGNWGNLWVGIFAAVAMLLLLKFLDHP
jgi:hypothetical protein